MCYFSYIFFVIYIIKMLDGVSNRVKLFEWKNDDIKSRFGMGNMEVF